MSSAPLYQVLGIEPARLKVAGDRERIRYTEAILNDPAHWQWGEIRGQLAFNYFLLACVAYLEGDTTTAEDSFVKVIRYCKEHYFGEWRSTYKLEQSKGNPDFWRARPCIERFSEAVVACAVVGDWTSAADLARYPDERCRNPLSKGADEEWNLALALADWLEHGEFTPAGREHLQKARQGKAARPREEAKLLEAAAEKNEAEMVATFQAFMKFYKARVFPTRNLTDKQSKAGTFWYHWFKKEGVDLDPDGKWSDHLIRLPATKVLA